MVQTGTSHRSKALDLEYFFTDVKVQVSESNVEPVKHGHGRGAAKTVEKRIVVKRACNICR